MSELPGRSSRHNNLPAFALCGTHEQAKFLCRFKNLDNGGLEAKNIYRHKQIYSKDQRWDHQSASNNETMQRSINGQCLKGSLMRINFKYTDIHILKLSWWVSRQVVKLSLTTILIFYKVLVNTKHYVWFYRLRRNAMKLE